MDYVIESGGMTTKINRVLASMHPKQKGFFTDPAKAKCLLGGRQGGKTYGVSLWLVADWERYPGQTAVYITKEANTAERRSWPQIKKICQEFGLPAKFNNSNLTATFPNGYVVLCTGCKDKNAADRLRGEAFGFIKIAVDEPATFDSELLEYLCTEVATWTLLQTNGDMLLCGTPGAITKGFWYDICHSEMWSKHVFTVLDNPYVPNPELVLADYCRRFGYKPTSPRVRREFFAEWCMDTEALVYLTDEETFISQNGYYELPTKRPPDLTTLGVDLGYSPDPCAFAVVSSWRDRPDMWLRKSYTKEKLTPDLVAQEIRQIKREFNVHRVIVDAGGGGLTTAKALALSYNVHVEHTPKGVKRPKIDMLRGAINAFMLRVHLVQAQEFVAEVKTIVWDDAMTKHNEMCSDHNADAVIQACLPHSQFALEFAAEAQEGGDLSPDKAAAFAQALESGFSDDH